MKGREGRGEGEGEKAKRDETRAHMFSISSLLSIDPLSVVEAAGRGGREGEFQDIRDFLSVADRRDGHSRWMDVTRVGRRA